MSWQLPDATNNITDATNDISRNQATKHMNKITSDHDKNALFYSIIRHYHKVEGHGEKRANGPLGKNKGYEVHFLVIITPRWSRLLQTLYRPNCPKGEFQNNYQVKQND